MGEVAQKLMLCQFSIDLRLILNVLGTMGYASEQQNGGIDGKELDRATKMYRIRGY